jgi:Amt family ammonium transporter
VTAAKENLDTMKMQIARAAKIALFAAPVLLLQLAPAFADDAPAAAPKLDSGDTAWMLTSTALVLMMTIPGLALFYAGMVRKKNVLATMMQSFIITCLVTIVWMICGYTLAFTTGGAYIGDLSRFFLSGFGDGWDQAFTLGAGSTPNARSGCRPGSTTAR